MGSGIATALILSGMAHTVRYAALQCLTLSTQSYVKARNQTEGISSCLSFFPSCSGVDVILKEVNQQFLDGGMARIKSNLASRVKKGAMTQAQADAALSKVKGTLDYADFKK